MTTKSGPAGADIPGARPTEKGGTLWTPREYRKPHRDDHDHQGQLVIDPETGEESGSTRFTSAAVALAKLADSPTPNTQGRPSFTRCSGA
jgi:hypothetical protein